MPTSKVIILAGAPTSSSLRWDESELSDEVHPCFHEGPLRSSTAIESSPTRWRLVEPPTSCNPATLEDRISFAEEATFFVATDVSFLSTSKAVDGESSFEDIDGLSQFYDQSFAIHEDIPSSQISIPISSGTESLDESFWADSTVELEERSSNNSNSQSADTGSVPRLPSILGQVTDLGEIPNAAYLRSINPQTMTVNLIVAIISLYPRRRIKTRRWGRKMDIVEMVTADETKSGFGITFWLQPAAAEEQQRESKFHQDTLEESLSYLRPRDIVLLRNVALSSFKDKVHGQSLRKDMTKIDLLHRHPISSTDQTGICPTSAINGSNAHAHQSDPHLLKIRRVRNWIMDFVGSGVYGGVGAAGTHPVGDMGKPLLPPDTQ